MTDDAQWEVRQTSDATNDALEAERRRLAQQLDERVLSHLTLMLAQINVYEQTLTTVDAQMVASVVGALTRQLVQQVRDVANSLAPLTLETLGLEAALETLASQTQRASGAHIALSLQRLPERLPPDLELALLRLTQAAVEQATRNARATFMAIRLELAPEGWYYSIQDNGAARDAETLRQACTRLEALGARITSGVSRYGGTELIIGLPRTVTIDLTERELAVLHCVVEGLGNKAIALQLGIQARTVKFHLDNVYAKLQVNTRTEAAVYALRHGLVKRQR